MVHAVRAKSCPARVSLGWDFLSVVSYVAECRYEIVGQAVNPAGDVERGDYYKNRILPVKSPGEVSKWCNGLGHNGLLKLFDCSQGRQTTESSTWQAKKRQVLGSYLIPACKDMSLVAYISWTRLFLVQSCILDFEFICVKLGLVISVCIISRVHDDRTLRDSYLKWKSRHLGPGKEMVCFSLSEIWAAAFIPLWKELWRERRKYRVIDDSCINLLSSQ